MYHCVLAFPLTDSALVLSSITSSLDSAFSSQIEHFTQTLLSLWIHFVSSHGFLSTVLSEWVQLTWLRWLGGWGFSLHCLSSCGKLAWASSPGGGRFASSNRGQTPLWKCFFSLLCLWWFSNGRCPNQVLRLTPASRGREIDATFCWEELQTTGFLKICHLRLGTLFNGDSSC